MSKTKMRCINCGKWFQSANAREVTCPDCTQKARKEKQAAKNAPSTQNKAAGAAAAPRTVAPPPKPKPAQSGTNQWLDSLSDVKIAQPEPPPQRPKIPSPPVQRDRGNGPAGSRPAGPPSQGQRDGNAPRGNGPGRGPAAYHVSNGNTLTASPGQRPPQPYRPTEGGPNRGGGRGKPWAKGAGPGGPRGGKKPKVPKPAAAPKPKREKTPPPEPFNPTPEQITQVEERYIALAQPSEFDGIRTQIAKEFSIPKKAVKKIIKDLRDRQHIPSWWEIQTYKGSQEELDRIKALYEPYLPVPPVGVHKKISDELDLKPGTVYQAIKAIRTEMNLPQYNDPKFHEEELAEHIKRAQAKKAAAEAAKAAAAAESQQKEGETKKEGAESEAGQEIAVAVADSPTTKTEAPKPEATSTASESEAPKPESSTATSEAEAPKPEAAEATTSEPKASEHESSAVASEADSSSAAHE